MNDTTGSVLLVEDDDDLREIMAETLASDGHLVLEARNGREALDLLRRTEPLPRLIILDLMMPVMNGAQFCAEQQRDPHLRDIPVVLVSASSQLQATAEGLRVQDVVSKPLALSTLLSIARRYTSSAPGARAPEAHPRAP